MVLIEFLEKARELNKAVHLEGEGIDCERIQPDENPFFEQGCLILDDRVFDCKYIAFGKLTKNQAQIEKELRDHMEKIRGKHGL